MLRSLFIVLGLFGTLVVVHSKKLTPIFCTTAGPPVSRMGAIQQVFGMISSQIRTRVGACFGRCWAIWGQFGDDLGAIWCPKSGLFAQDAPIGTKTLPRRFQDGIWGPLRPIWGRSWGPRWPHISAINRPKRPQEGPTSVLGSGPRATLRHTYYLIDSKTLKVTKQRCSACR